MFLSYRILNIIHLFEGPTIIGKFFILKCCHKNNSFSHSHERKFRIKYDWILEYFRILKILKTAFFSREASRRPAYEVSRWKTGGLIGGLQASKSGSKKQKGSFLLETFVFWFFETSKTLFIPV